VRDAWSNASEDSGIRVVARIVAMIKAAYLPFESIFQLCEIYEVKNSENW